MGKYTKAQAAEKARQIHDRFGQRIADACAGSVVPVDFLGGFVGVEAGVDRAGHISETAVRFEPGVFHHLQLVRDGLAHAWSRITTADLKGATDDALRNLATSYGLTQIMGWHMIHDLEGAISDLRDPEKHLKFAVQLLEIVGGRYLRKKNFDAVLHIWNSGTPTGRTYDPDYVHNALAVMAAYGAVAGSQLPVVSDENDSAAASPTTDPEPSTEDAPVITQPASVSTSTEQPPTLEGGGRKAEGESENGSFAAYLPQMDTAKTWIKRAFAGTSIGAALAVIGGWPLWLQIGLFSLVVVIIVGSIVIFVKYHDKIFAYVTAMNTLRAQPGAANPVISGRPPA